MDGGAVDDVIGRVVVTGVATTTAVSTSVGYPHIPNTTVTVVSCFAIGLSLWPMGILVDNCAEKVRRRRDNPAPPSMSENP